MTHFYMTLPSNSSSQYYPDNTVACFKTRLSTPVSLSGDWEVALFEIEYPRSYYNVYKEDVEIEYFYKHPPGGLMARQSLYIKEGYYSSVFDLVGAINMQLLQFKDRVGLEKVPHFTYSQITQRLGCKLQLGDKFQFSVDMCLKLGIGLDNPCSNIGTSVKLVLGLNAPCNINAELDWQAEGICNLDRENRSMYVYCNVLEHVHVGDVRAPLLRIVGTTGKHGDHVRRIFDRPLYVPLQQKEFDTIDIDIRRDTGDLIPFESGKSAVTLHFRLCKNPYFLK